MNEPNIRCREFEVTGLCDGWRLDRFLAHKLSRLSRSKAGRICKFGDLEIRPPRRIKASLRVRRGDVVVVREHLPPEYVQYDEVVILYEDEHLLVVNKPPGMLIHEAASVRQNTIDAWLEYVGYVGGEAVHRLDRETSGCVVCGKNRAAIAELRHMFATSHPEKIYCARVLDPDHRWEPGMAQILLDTPLGLVGGDGGELSIRMGRGPLEARTWVDVVGEGCLEGFGRYSDLMVRIETGRQHQIRVHLSFEGTPVAGDKLYTYDDAFFKGVMEGDPSLVAMLPYENHALHAYSIKFKHPVMQQVVSVTAPSPFAPSTILRTPLESR